MTSKSELKRRASTDPFWAAERIYKLEEQIKVAIEALEFYANMDNWTRNDLGELNQVVASDCGHELNLLGEQPYGNRARTALAKIRGEK